MEGSSSHEQPRRTNGATAPLPVPASGHTHLDAQSRTPQSALRADMWLWRHQAACDFQVIDNGNGQRVLFPGTALVLRRPESRPE